MKKIIAICLVLVMALSLCACGGSAGPEEVLLSTAQKMSSLQSCSFGMEMKIAMSSEGIELPVTLSVQGEMTMEPQIIHMNTVMDLMILAFNMDIYTDTRGDHVISYIGADMGNGMEWSRDEVVQEEPVVNLAHNAAQYLKLLSTVQEVPEKEMVGDVEATRYTAVITGDNIRTMLETIGSLEGIDDVLGEDAELEEALETLDPNAGMTVSCLIDQKNSTLLEISIDMTELLAGTVTSEEMGMAVSEVTMILTFNDFDAVAPIVIPEEALNAPEA